VSCRFMIVHAGRRLPVSGVRGPVRPAATARAANGDTVGAMRVERQPPSGFQVLRGVAGRLARPCQTLSRLASSANVSISCIARSAVSQCLGPSCELTQLLTKFVKRSAFCDAVAAQEGIPFTGWHLAQKRHIARLGCWAS